MKSIGPDGYVKGQWFQLDLTDWTSAAKRHGYSRSQGPAVQVVSFSNDRYTVVDANGYRFRAYAFELR